MNNDALTVENIVVEYKRKGQLRAVDDVSLTVNPGEVVALVGESGCGKSSLARAIVGIEHRTSGNVHLGQREVQTLGFRRRSLADTDIQMVFQDPTSSLNPRRSIAQQIGDGIATARARNVAASSIASPAEWLNRVGLNPNLVNRYPHEFSGGQKQRIAIARSLAAAPRILVADEPISALDASTQTSVAALMRSLCANTGTGMLFISHDLSVVRRIADRTLVMYAGKIVESGDTETLWTNPIHPYTKALFEAIPIPDGTGTLPTEPTDEERLAWSRVIPEALNRTPVA